jgi:hypothetical protein
VERLEICGKREKFSRNALHYQTGHNFLVPKGWTKNRRLGACGAAGKLHWLTRE